MEILQNVARRARAVFDDFYMKHIELTAEDVDNMYKAVPLQRAAIPAARAKDLQLSAASPAKYMVVTAKLRMTGQHPVVKRHVVPVPSIRVYDLITDEEFENRLHHRDLAKSIVMEECANLIRQNMPYRIAGPYWNSLQFEWDHIDWSFTTWGELQHNPFH